MPAIQSLTLFTDTQFTILSKKAQSPHDFEVNTLYEDIHPAKNDVSLASFAKLSVQHPPSQLKQKNERTAQEGRPDMILI